MTKIIVISGVILCSKIFVKNKLFLMNKSITHSTGGGQGRGWKESFLKALVKESGQRAKRKNV